MKASVRAAILLLLVFGIGFTFSFVLEENVHKITNIDLEFAGESGLESSFEQLRPTLTKKLSRFMGKKVWLISLEEILSEVESDQRVATAQVVRVFPNRLLVKLTPHRPVLNMMALSGRELFPITRDGGILPAVKMNAAKDLPVLRGVNFHKEAELRERAVHLMSKIPLDGTLTPAMVSEIRYDKKQGFEFSLVQSSSVVKLGHDEFEKKLEQVDRVLKYLISEQLEGRVIDARLSKKVVVRLRNAP